MTTQLRLVETQVDTPVDTPVERRAPRRGGTPKARLARPARRAVDWGEWHLDARTRRVGRAGVAAARRALEDAPAREPLSEAS